MGSVYKSTSHFYFCVVIKKKIKKHYLVYDTFAKKWENSGLLDDLTGLIPDAISPQYPNNWQVNLAGQERLVLEADGDMRITGRLHAIGNVIWNQGLQRLEFWDGTMWQHLVTNNIV